MNRLFVFACLIPLFFGTGCASVFSGTRQEVSFDSTPQGARVTLNGLDLGTTPFTSDIKRWKSGKLRFTKSGYVPVQTELDKGLNGLVALDILWFIPGILPGVGALAIDFTTGAAFEFGKRYSATLEPLTTVRKVQAVPTIPKRRR